MGGLLWQLGPREGAGLPAALRSEPRGRRELGLLGPEAGGEKFSFFFLLFVFFSFISKPFSNQFETIFELCSKSHSTKI